MNNGWKPRLHVNSWSCCRLLAFTLRSSLAVLPPFGLFSWSQPFTPADFLLFPLTARLFHALLSPGPPAGWAARSSDGLIRLPPREIPGLWRTAMKSQTNALFCYLYGGAGGTAPPPSPPDVTVRLNADKPKVGKPNVSTREEQAVCCFPVCFVYFNISKRNLLFIMFPFISDSISRLSSRWRLSLPVVFVISEGAVLFRANRFGQRDPRTSVCHAL